MDFKGQHILSGKQFNREAIERVLALAEKMEPYAKERKTLHLLDDAVIAALFYEPSTRTRLSFETAAHRLGARVVSVPSKDTSSLSKGETLEDNGKIVSIYADVIVARHPDPGSVDQIAAGASVPVISAGDGQGEHPTQALLDLYTIKKERGTLDGLHIALTGDLKFGRTVHSLAYVLSNFDVKLSLVAPEQLEMPTEIIAHLKERNIEVHMAETMSEVLPDLDVLYCTRVQKERFKNEKEYDKLKHHFIVTRDLIVNNNPKVTILHPLPRVGELAEDVDGLEGAAYFREASNGVPVRMALYALVLGKDV